MAITITTMWLWVAEGLACD